MNIYLPTLMFIYQAFIILLKKDTINPNIQENVTVVRKPHSKNVLNLTLKKMN